MNFLKKIFQKKTKPKLSRRDYNDYFTRNEINGTALTHLFLGNVAIPTGQLIICDPLVYFHNSQPFDRSVKPGNYPVTVCIAKTLSSGDRYAIVKLEFSNSKAVRFEMTTTNEQNVDELTDENDFFGFPVDAGLGCFMDVKTRQFFNEFDDSFMKNNPTGNIYDDLLAAEFKKNASDPTDPHEAGDWLNFSLPNQPELNIIMFQSGYGDGVYPSYWGINEQGEICSLIIDFDVI